MKIGVFAHLCCFDLTQQYITQSWEHVRGLINVRKGNPAKTRQYKIILRRQFFPELITNLIDYKCTRSESREYSQVLRHKPNWNRKTILIMKSAFLIIFATAITALVESSSGMKDSRQPAPYINRLPPPKPRFRRSPEPEPQGSLSATWQKNMNGPERRPSYNIDYQHKIFENKHGSIGATAGAQKSPGQRWQPTVGLQGSFRFRRSSEARPEP